MSDIETTTYLSQTLHGVTFPNPIIVGSCSLTRDAGTALELVRHGAGGIVTKTISTEPLVATESFTTSRFGQSLAVTGDPRMTLEQGVSFVRDMKNHSDVPVIVNVIGKATEGESWAEISETLADAGADMIELDLNGHPEGPEAERFPATLGTLRKYSIGQDPELTAAITEAVVSAVRVPVIAKMTLRAPDMVAVAAAAVEAGAHLLSGVNTLHGVPDVTVERHPRPDVGPVGKTSLTAVCGPDLAALGARWTAILSREFAVPYISGSGVMSAYDVLSRLAWGARLTSVCSSLYIEGMSVLDRYSEEFLAFMEEHEVSRIDEIVGSALTQLVEPGGETRNDAYTPAIVDRERWEQVGPEVRQVLEGVCTCEPRDPDSAVGCRCGLQKLRANGQRTSLSAQAVVQ